MNDWQLLQEYVHQQSEAAFAAVVERYVHFVYSAAIRQTNDPALAEDISQSVFTLLARKAPTLTQNTMLGGWLFQTTRHVALTAIRGDQRRRRRELAAAHLVHVESEHDLWAEIAPMLDESIAQLSDHDRALVLLRFFEKKSFREIGSALGIREDAAKKRVARAVEKLRQLLAGRGCATTGTVLAGWLATRAVQSAPALLLERISVSALLKRGSGALSLLLAELEREATWATAKLAVGVFALIALVALIGTVAWLQFRPAQIRARPAVAAVERPPAPQPVQLATLSPPLSPAFPLRVVAANDGHALAAVPVHVDFNGPENVSIELITDNNGRCRIPLTAHTFRSLQATVTAAGYVPKASEWFLYEFQTQTVVEEYVLPLEPGRNLAGLIQDETGQPIGKAKFTLNFATALAEREQIGTVSGESDLEGRWALDQIPAGVDTAWVTADPPDFAPFRTNLVLIPSSLSPPVFVFQRGVSIAGLVVDASGLPLPDARVTDDPQETVQTWTESDGQFYLPHVHLGKLRLKAQAPGFTETVTELECLADSDGNRMVLMPAARTNSVRSWGESSERAIRIRGKVNDFETGQPIERFKVLLGSSSVISTAPLSSTWLRGDPEFLGEAAGGTFDWYCWLRKPGLQRFALEIRAPGYAPTVSEHMAVDGANHELQFRLKRNDRVTGHVLTPDGQPAAGARVQLTGKDSQAAVESSSSQPLGFFVRAPREFETQATTDAHGQFSLKTVAGLDKVIFLHESGCRMVRLESLGIKPIVLESWARIGGDLHIGPAVGTNRSVGIETDLGPGGDRQIPFSGFSRTDGEGRFIFARVPPGTYHLFRIVRSPASPPGAYGMSHHTAVAVHPGEVKQLTIGGRGRRVIGRIRAVPEIAITNCIAHLQTQTGQLPIEAALNANNNALDPSTLYRQQQMEFLIGRYFLEVSMDGSFVGEDMPPGSYQLSIQLPARGALTTAVQIPETLDGRNSNPVDLGTVTLELNALSRVE